MTAHHEHPAPRRRRKPVAEHKPQSEDDLWLDQLHMRCAKAMVRHLSAATNLLRPIKSLTSLEMKALAAACMTEWIIAVSERKYGGGPKAPSKTADQHETLIA